MLARLLRLRFLFALTVLVVGCAVQSGGQPPSSTPLSASSAAPTRALTSAPSSTGPQPTSDAVPVAADDPVWGAADAPVTMVEFSDLQCPFCSRVNTTLTQLRAKYGPSKLRIVYKHNPLPFHEHAMPAAKVAEAVRGQAGNQAFFAFLDLAFAHQTELSDGSLQSWVAAIGLDPNLVLARAGLPQTTQKIEGDMALAVKLGANGTPAFRINGVTLSGAQPQSSFEEVIDAELVAAAQLQRAGTAPASVYPARVAVNFHAPTPTADEPEEKDDLTIWQVPAKGAPAIGPKDALVTIVEFYDYQCPFCRRVHATMTELLARYPKDLRLVMRQNPLPFHPRARPAANLALEARAEKGDTGFFAADSGLFDDARGLDDDALLKLGAELKLDPKKTEAAIHKDTHAAEIEADQDIATDFEAHGTPHFFINGMRISGARPTEDFVTAIDAQLKVAQELVKSGTPRARIYDEILSHAKGPAAPEQKSVPAPSADNPTRGPVNAPVVIHEFADFQCPFCGRVEPTLVELEKAFPGKLRFVWHDLPLPFHENARPAALAAREARAQKGDAGFWQMHDLLFRDQREDTAFSAKSYAHYADMLHIDPARFEAAKTDARYDAVLAKDQAIATAAGISGTPAFVINGFYVSGAQPLSAFKRAVRLALAAKPVAAPAAKPPLTVTTPKTP